MAELQEKLIDCDEVKEQLLTKLYNSSNFS